MRQRSGFNPDKTRFFRASLFLSNVYLPVLDCSVQMSETELFSARNTQVQGTKRGRRRREDLDPFQFYTLRLLTQNKNAFKTSLNNFANIYLNYKYSISHVDFFRKLTAHCYLETRRTFCKTSHLQSPILSDATQWISQPVIKCIQSFP